MTGRGSSFAALSRRQLATLVPELLLCGQLIDRAGLGHVLVALGPDGMRDVAIEEWMGASPVYTRRMQRALGFEGDDVITIFKGLQLDIGAPPQFMDFRYTVHDRFHGEFALAHCGALMDVEPMGEGFVVSMCHDIEDPTFDATAVATNPRAQVRPIHRPPRVPAGRTPHCAWTVCIEDGNPAVTAPATSLLMAATAAGRFTASPIDPGDEGAADYGGPLLADVDFGDFSHSALVRIAEEVCLQGHLLVLSFLLSLRTRMAEAQVREIGRRQLTGIAGVAAERIKAALALPDGIDGVATLLAIHPAFNPVGYAEVTTARDGDALTVRIARGTPADGDGAWPSLLAADHVEPLRAIVGPFGPSLRVDVRSETPAALEVSVSVGTEEQAVANEVLMTRISTGASFVFDDRGRGLPLLPSH